MAVIKIGEHSDITSFLKAVAAVAATKNFFDFDNYPSQVIPRRIFSAMPKTNLTSKSSFTLTKPTLTNGWLYSAVTPKTFNQFMMDFQAAAQDGSAVETVVVTRTKLKPYVSINVKFGSAAAPTAAIAPIAATKAVHVGDRLALADLFTVTGAAATSFTLTAAPAAGVTITGQSLVVAAGATGSIVVTATHSNLSTVKASVTLTVTAAP